MDRCGGQWEDGTLSSLSGGNPIRQQDCTTAGSMLIPVSCDLQSNYCGGSLIHVSILLQAEAGICSIKLFYHF